MTRPLEEMDWEATLAQLFAATVNQQTLEEAATLMVSVSARDPDYHDECMYVLDRAIASAEAGNRNVITCINKSGYKVEGLEAALDLLRDFRAIYLQVFGSS